MITRNNEGLVGNKKAYYELNREKILARRAIHLLKTGKGIQPGERFYKLVVVRLAESYRSWSGNRLSVRKQWLVKCDCGNEFPTSGTKLRRGDVLMCRSCASALRPQSQLKLRGIEKVFNRVVGQRAKRKGILVDLPLDVFEKLIVQNCHYCGTHPSSRNYLGNKTTAVELNGIDRIDSSKGYVIGNVVPCCKRCNQAKNDMTCDEFLEWVNRVYKHSVVHCCAG